MEKILQKRDLIVADPTGAMFLSLWDGLVDQVEIQRLYLFTNVKVAFFKKRFLNTTSKSVISVLEESIGLPRKVEERVKILEMPDNNIEKFRGKILSAEVSQTFVCINCKGRIHEDLINNAKSVVKCQQCNLSTLKKNMTNHMMANIIIQAEGDDKTASVRYHCPMVALTCLQF
jgi:DNA-directed RNA polymerase subunit RPC12/RpoP/RNAse (barnase) inhibitor barstar